MYVYAYANKLAYTHIHAHAYAYSHISHSCTHTTHTHTQVHIHTMMISLVDVLRGATISRCPTVVHTACVYVCISNECVRARAVVARVFIR